MLKGEKNKNGKSTFYFTHPLNTAHTNVINLTELLQDLTLLTLPGVVVAASRLLDGVLTEVPYNMSS